MSLPDQLFNKLMTSVRRYIKKEENIDAIVKAYEYAKKMHTNQYRKSGEPYIIHPIEVSYILSEFNTGPRTIIAGLLHDVIEDTDATKEEVVELFGDEVFCLVDGVTKLEKIKYVSREQQLAKNYQKMFLAMARDIRVIIIKLADRLHNMRTLNYRSEQNQIKVSQETIEIYVPIAHRLGMYRLKSELEDRCLRFMDPTTYYGIAKLINAKQREREADIQGMVDGIDKILTDHHLKFKIKGRVKNIYSVHKKMKEKNKDFSEIFDLLALRLIVDNEVDCYHVLGLIHANYKPIPNRFKDYIAMPKPNLYQSLHTTIITNTGKIFEVQIRTKEMDEIAEYGVAAHWAYKEENKPITLEQEQREIQQKLKWYKELINYANESDAEQFLDIVRGDIFSANVYVFTPNGDVLDFPKDSTPIDFAYRIHSEIGNKTVGAIVNGKIVPLTYKFKTGDICEIRTSSQSYGPSEDWLKIVKTSQAKSKIKQFFNKQNRKELVEAGKEKLLKEFAAIKEDFSKFQKDEIISDVFGKQGVKSLEDLYYHVGKKSISAKSVVNKFTEDTELDAQYWLEHFSEDNLKDRIKKYKSSDSGIIIEGLNNPQVRVSKCCNPVPGDEIVGYISKGNGIAVHRKECKNIQGVGEERLIEVFWAEDILTRKYDVDLKITGFERPTLLTDIIQMINAQGISLLSISAQVTPEGFSIVKVKVSITNLLLLNNLVVNIKRIHDIYSVERIIK